MRVQRVVLRNFRNIEETSFEPEPGLNFLVGANGQGKTSAIEALGFLATLRSFRGARSDEVVRWGAETGEVLCTLAPGASEDGWRTELRVVFQRSGPQAGGRTTKVAFVNGKPFRSSASYLNQRFGSFELGFHAVVFNPSDHDLIQGDPAGRRVFLDRVLAAEDASVLSLLQRYGRLLEQRNALLKQAPSRAMLEGFTEPLADQGSRIVLKRLEWLSKAQQPLRDAMHELAPTQAGIGLCYQSKWAPLAGVLAGQDPVPSLEILNRSFRESLRQQEASELRLGVTLVGPHRDDWAFLLGSQLLKGHGSQGEVRSALLALKLTEIGLFRQATGHRPLFLLDDFSSELDQGRRNALLRFLSESDLQAVVTTTDDAVLGGKKYWVAKGILGAA